MRTGSGLFTVSSAAPYAETTTRAVRPAEPSRYARVYTGTSPKPAIADEAETPAFHRTSYNNSLTSDFSSFSSATDALIFSRLKSFIGSPCTISHFPPRTQTGNDVINPFSTS